MANFSFLLTTLINMPLIFLISFINTYQYRYHTNECDYKEHVEEFRHFYLEIYFYFRDATNGIELH